jgi:hypothetical protein
MWCGGPFAEALAGDPMWEDRTQGTVRGCPIECSHRRDVHGGVSRMAFSPQAREEALVRSRRTCCVCHQFAGRNVEVHHIEPESEGGSNDLANAIVLCFRCHSEAGRYNNRHPKGSKYSPPSFVATEIPGGVTVGATIAIMNDRQDSWSRQPALADHFPFTKRPLACCGLIGQTTLRLSKPLSLRDDCFRALKCTSHRAILPTSCMA